MFPMAKRSSEESENGEEDCCEGEVVNEDVRKRKIIIRVVYGQGSRTASSGCSSSSSSTLLCCQADECGMDLRMAKKYHQRHKVCERHSKAAVVLVSGIRQRFCQQCSKFHEISLFDDTKRSCRERLAGHNERRRKTYGDLDFGTRQRLQINGLNRAPRITIDK